jgi:hypothetical protein
VYKALIDVEVVVEVVEVVEAVKEALIEVAIVAGEDIEVEDVVVELEEEVNIEVMAIITLVIGCYC